MTTYAPLNAAPLVPPYIKNPSPFPQNSSPTQPSRTKEKKKEQRDPNELPNNYLKLSTDSFQASVVSPFVLTEPLSHGEDEIVNINKLLKEDSEDEKVGEEEDGRTAAEDEFVCVFVESPQANLLCPIHRGLFANPVIARCGHSFCRAWYFLRINLCLTSLKVLRNGSNRLPNKQTSAH
jgi:hypothetical protein